MQKETKRISLEVSNLTKKIGETPILNNLSFWLPEGAIVGFLGQNGAGKTTTLKAISNIIPRDDGIISVAGNPLEKKDRDKVMFLPDTPLVYPVLTGHEYLSFMSDLLNHDLEDYTYYLQLLKLNDSIHKRVSEYSLGMKKKLSLIPFLLKKPKILLLDEFFSGIDPISIRDIKLVLQKYVSEGNSILLSTHQLDAAQTICDYIIIIDKGRVVSTTTATKKIVDEDGSLEDYFVKSIHKK
ncbi:ABC transporter ATP-binding protein [Halalkalibacter krulwichiae]|uniref:Putative ABC transporter ATP-binding protein YxlF n=1 Tax=Halalkalibacter krulwichiae TaxID=199441 RepID=A0A1X9MG06_9BACI|nr:ABC transporter ATP-binding protein [Halalkalibacter krulwichiae]ARK32387.1 putative ABC transporter ATP-binding protein YxlF [Halalkalibacter krulwichiae]